MVTGHGSSAYHKAMTSGTMLIDTVDLSSTTAASDLERALRSTGFVQLVGHGLNPERRTKCYEAVGAFFDLAPEVKANYIHPDSAANRGYRAKGSEALAYSLGKESPPDLFESFNAAPAPKVLSPLQQATPWPDDIAAGFSTTLLEHFAELSALSTRLDQMIGELIGAPWLAERSGSGTDMLASIKYSPGPDGTEDAVEGQQRMGAHTDYSSFTILDADPLPGLQLVSPDNEWVDVIPDEDAVLMNVGDLLAILTNNVWPSTLHRVVPMSAGSAPTRRSAAFFHYPNLDVEISTLPEFITDDNPKSYESLVVGEHLLDKLLAPKDKVKSTSAMTTAGRTT